MWETVNVIWAFVFPFPRHPGQISNNKKGGEFIGVHALVLFLWKVIARGLGVIFQRLELSLEHSKIKKGGGAIVWKTCKRSPDQLSPHRNCVGATVGPAMWNMYPPLMGA